MTAAVLDAGEDAPDRAGVGVDGLDRALHESEGAADPGVRAGDGGVLVGCGNAGSGNGGAAFGSSAGRAGNAEALFRCGDAIAEFLDEPVLERVDALELHLAAQHDVLLDLDAVQRENIESVLLVVSVRSALADALRVALGDAGAAGDAEALGHVGLVGVLIDRRAAVHEVDDPVEEDLGDDAAAVRGGVRKGSTLLLVQIAEKTNAVLGHSHVLEPCAAILGSGVVIDFFRHGSISFSFDFFGAGFEIGRSLFLCRFCGSLPGLQLVADSLAFGDVRVRLRGQRIDVSSRSLDLDGDLLAPGAELFAALEQLLGRLAGEIKHFYSPPVS